MTLTPQQPTEIGAPAPDARHYPTVYQHPHSSMVLQGAPQQQQQVASYVVAGPPGGLPGVLQGQPITIQPPGPNHTYPSSTPGPAAFPGSSLNQQLIQQHTYFQQPVQQVETNANQLYEILCVTFNCIDCWGASDIKLLLIISYRCPHVTALHPTTPTAPFSSSSIIGPTSTHYPITALRTKTWPSNKVWTQMFSKNSELIVELCTPKTANYYNIAN